MPLDTSRTADALDDSMQSPAGGGTLKAGETHAGCQATVVGRSPSAATQADGDRPAAAAAPMPHVPGYQMLSFLGRGAMGSVYRAREIKLNREVAVKFIELGERPKPEEVLRFQIEAESLASIQHANIVQVYEVGEHAGQLYLAMELVGGSDLRDHLDRQALSPREAAVLVAKMARAVHAMHLRGIIHRDLKPENILLTTENEPKLADFGVAKRVETDCRITRAGMIVGTPVYMSPEQADGYSRDVGPPSDVFSLGVILYELLSGFLPFVGDDVMSTLDMIRLQDPPPLSGIAGRLPRDLETICLKCLEKSTARRYQSAAELADDLERFLRGEPVSARPLSVVERSWKWARRHPALAATSLLLACVLALGSMAAVWHHRTIRVERYATARFFDLSQEAIELLLTEVAEEQLPATSHMAQQRKLILESARDFYQRLYDEHLQTPHMRADLARTQTRLADVQRWLEDYQLSKNSYERASQILQQVLDRDPNDADLRCRLADSLHGEAEVCRLTEQHAEAVEHFRRAIAIYRGLTAHFPEELEYAADMSRSHYSLALCLQADRDPEAARTELEAAISLLNQIADSGQANSRHLHGLARSHGALGHVLKQLKQHDKVEAAYRQAIELYETLKQRHPHDHEYHYGHATLLNRLGNHLVDQSRSEEAEEHHELARDALHFLSEMYPSVAAFQRELAATHEKLEQIGAP